MMKTIGIKNIKMGSKNDDSSQAPDTFKSGKINLTELKHQEGQLDDGDYLDDPDGDLTITVPPHDYSDQHVQ